VQLQLEAGLKLEVKFQYSHGGGTVACHLLELPSVQLATFTAQRGTEH
jgi:hypothetical protein